MSTLCDVTVILNGYPTKALHDALTSPIPDSRGQALAVIPTDKAGGHKVYTGHIYAACFNHVLVSELEEFFRNIPNGAWGATGGLVVVDHEHEDAPIVNWIGYRRLPAS